MKTTSDKAKLIAHLATLIGCDARAIALPIARLYRRSAVMFRINERECSVERTETETAADEKAYNDALTAAKQTAAAISEHIKLAEVGDPRGGAGIALLWTGVGRLPGNTFGGDESGWYL